MSLSSSYISPAASGWLRGVIKMFVLPEITDTLMVIAPPDLFDKLKDLIVVSMFAAVLAALVLVLPENTGIG